MEVLIWKLQKLLLKGTSPPCTLQTSAKTNTFLNH